jgi:hypothetical protein
VGASATDSDHPSGAALAAALGRADEAGLLAAHDSYGPDLLGYAEFLLAGRSSAATEPADEAAAAVLDALLVASGAVADLADRDRMPTWLFALTRNECLRRGAVTAPEAEAAELGRRGLGPLQVAALLGFAPAALPGRVPPTATPPAWLEAELVAAAGPEGAGRRAELTRRARPFEPDGFPVPLDRRRLSSKVLAWSAGAVVVIALGLLVGLPAKGNAGGSGPAPAALAGTPAPTAVAAPPAPVRSGRRHLGTGAVHRGLRGGRHRASRRPGADHEGTGRPAAAQRRGRPRLPHVRGGRAELDAGVGVLRRVDRPAARDDRRGGGVPGDRGGAAGRRDGRPAAGRRRLVRRPHRPAGEPDGVRDGLRRRPGPPGLRAAAGQLLSALSAARAAVAPGSGPVRSAPRRTDRPRPATARTRR